MDTAKVFTNGGSQAVRLPKNYRFDTSEVFVNQIGNVVMLIPKNDRWQSLLASLPLFTDDFLSEPIEALPIDEPISFDDSVDAPSTDTSALETANSADAAHASA